MERKGLAILICTDDIKADGITYELTKLGINFCDHMHLDRVKEIINSGKSQCVYGQSELYEAIELEELRRYAPTIFLMSESRKEVLNHEDSSMVRFERASMVNNADYVFTYNQDTKIEVVKKAMDFIRKKGWL